MGGVLLKYDTAAMSAAFAENDEDAAVLEKALFASNEWRLADLGEVSQEELLHSALSRVPQRLSSVMTSLFEHWHEYMTPLDGAEECLKTLKDDGKKLYLLSNASERFESIRALNSGIFSWFDGMVVSAYEHSVKPDEKIYRTLLERFSLKAGECIFFDDMPKNVDGAKKCLLAASVFAGDFKSIQQFSRRNA